MELSNKDQNIALAAIVDQLLRSGADIQDVDNIAADLVAEFTAEKLAHYAEASE